MASQFKLAAGFVGKLPPGWQMAFSFPTPVNKTLHGRVELCVGSLGDGKTTWAALRAKRLALATGRQLATTGYDWGPGYRPVHSRADMEDLYDAVLIWDEINLWLPSTGQSMGKEQKEMGEFFVWWMQHARKRRCCIVAACPAWSRVKTNFRQLVTCVWLCRGIRPGVMHRATPHKVPDEGGTQVLPSQWYRPGWAEIPTLASAWSPLSEAYRLEAQAVAEAERRASELVSVPPPALYSPVAPTGYQYWR